jgi:hypothetical protein
MLGSCSTARHSTSATPDSTRASTRLLARQLYGQLKSPNTTSLMTRPPLTALFRRRLGHAVTGSSIGSNPAGEVVPVATVSVRYIVDDVDEAIAFYCQ